LNHGTLESFNATTTSTLTNCTTTTGTNLSSLINYNRIYSKTRIIDPNENMFNLVRHWERMRIEKKDGFRSAKIVLTKSKSFTKSDDSILKSTHNIIKSIMSHSHHIPINNSNNNNRSKSQALHASSNLNLIKSENNVNNLISNNSTTHKSLAVQQKRTKSSLNRLVRQKSFDENDHHKLEPIFQSSNNEVYSYIAKNDPTIAAFIAAAVESEKKEQKEKEEHHKDYSVALTTEIEKINEKIKEISYLSNTDKSKTKNNKFSFKSSTSTANSTSFSNDSSSFGTNNNSKESFKSPNVEVSNTIKNIDLNEMNELIESTLALSTETEINKLEPMEDIIDLDDDEDEDYQLTHQEKLDDYEDNEYQFIEANQENDHDYENKMEINMKQNIEDDLDQTESSNNYGNESNLKDMKTKTKGRLHRLLKFKF
jgi:hypothetical protein